MTATQKYFFTSSGGNFSIAIEQSSAEKGQGVLIRIFGMRGELRQFVITQQDLARLTEVLMLSQKEQP